MEKIVVATVSISNWIGQAGASIRHMDEWAGVISLWGRVIRFVVGEGNDKSLVVEELGSEDLLDRRAHPQFPGQRSEI